MRYSLIVLMLAVVGCSKPPSHSTTTKSTLQSIILQYYNYEGQHDTPPPNVDALLGFVPSLSAAQNRGQYIETSSTAALQSGDYVIIWSYDVSEDAERNSRVILAYHKSVPAEGGYVGFADGSARLLTKEEFASTEKAKPTANSNQ